MMTQLKSVSTFAIGSMVVVGSLAATTTAMAADKSALFTTAIAGATDAECVLTTTAKAPSGVPWSTYRHPNGGKELVPSSVNLNSYPVGVTFAAPHQTLSLAVPRLCSKITNSWADKVIKAIEKESMSLTASASNLALIEKVARPRPGDPPKPTAPTSLHKSWCTGNNCNRFCVASKSESKIVCQKDRNKSVNMDEFMKASNGFEPNDLVELVSAVRDGLAKHPDFPCTESDLAKCGVTFHAESGYEQKLRKGAVPGLVRAIVIARNWRNADNQPAGYGLHVGYSHRSLLCQTQLVCNHLGEATLCDGKELSCPGPNIHSDGVAIDFKLTKEGKVATGGGDAMECKDAEQFVKSKPNLLALHTILFGAGWWNYCKEPWHFEYTENPYSGKFRINGY